jgi:HlyD family secretion protein
VTVADGDDTVTSPVQVGLVGATRIEITDGLEVGDRVVLADLDKALPSETGGEGTEEPPGGTVEFRGPPPGGGGGGPRVQVK